MKLLFSLLLLCLTAPVSAQLDSLFGDAISAKMAAYFDSDSETPEQSYEDAILKFKKLKHTALNDAAVFEIAELYYEMGTHVKSPLENDTLLVNPSFDSARIYYSLAIKANKKNTIALYKLAVAQLWAKQYDAAKTNLIFAFEQDTTVKFKENALEEIVNNAYLFAVNAEESAHDKHFFSCKDLYRQSLMMLFCAYDFVDENIEVAILIYEVSKASDDNEIAGKFKTILKEKYDFVPDESHDIEMK